MIINISDLAKTALDEMFKNYKTDDLNNRRCIRVYLKEIA